MRVIVDSDLASLYGVTPRRLNEQVRRNIDRFPTDFMFQLTNQEFAKLEELERKLATHDKAIADIITTIREMLAAPATKKAPIGFVHSD